MHKKVRRETWAFYLCISPWLIGFLLFVVGPMIASFYISFTRWNLIEEARWVGMANFERLFLRDAKFWQSLRVTLLFTLLYVPTELVGGLGLALLMNQKIRGIKIIRTIYYLPSVLAGVAYVVVWMWMLNPEGGLVNGALAVFGIQGPRWLTDPDTALYAIWLMSIWGLGRTAIIYLAGLQGVPPALYEAASLDGARAGRLFWNITVPLITPTIFFNLILSIISTFQTFTSAYVSTNGGPLDSTLFYVLYIYQQAFGSFRMGYSSAMAWILFVIILVLTLIVVRSSSRWVYYEGEAT